jgi:hypothetical protein
MSFKNMIFRKCALKIEEKDWEAFSRGKYYFSKNKLKKRERFFLILT